MRTQRLAALLLGPLTLVMGANTALAFYNPCTGRWLSRDPLEEGGGANLSGFVGNSPLTAIDPLGMDIVVACPQKYFSSLGLEERRDYEGVGANRWRAKPTASVNYAGNLDMEIVWEMLFAGADRVLTAKGLDVEQLKRQVLARKNVVSEIANVRWSFGSDRQNPRFNPAFWQIAWQLREGVSAWNAVGDLFSNDANLYSTGCRYGSLFVLLKGVRDTTTPVDFNQISDAQGAFIEDQARASGLIHFQSVPEGSRGFEKSWVAGDRGVVEGSGHGLNGGQWLIYEGVGKFWGFGAKPDVRRLAEWISADGPDSGRRYYPGVGLERP